MTEEYNNKRKALRKQSLQLSLILARLDQEVAAEVDALREIKKQMKESDRLRKERGFE